jgi:hypothetical protein
LSCGDDDAHGGVFARGDGGGGDGLGLPHVSNERLSQTDEQTTSLSQRR